VSELSVGSKGSETTRGMHMVARDIQSIVGRRFATACRIELRHAAACYLLFPTGDKAGQIRSKTLQAIVSRISAAQGLALGDGDPEINTAW
jgi:hypothetical protein